MPSRSTDSQYSTNSSSRLDDLAAREEAARREEKAFLDAQRRSQPIKPCDPVTPIEADGSGGDDIATLLADFDMEAAAGTETAEEVIAAMTADDLIGGDDSDNPVRQSEDLPKWQNEAREAAAAFTKMAKPAGSEFTKMAKSAADFAILPNQKHHVSAFRDAKTMRQIRVLHDSPDFAGHTTLLVTKTLFYPPTSYPYRRPHKPWWDERPSLPSPARQYRSPAPWRDTSDHVRVTFRHLALKTFGPVYAVNLNLSPDVEALARAQAYPLGWLHDRISHHLKQALGRPAQFHLVMEEAGTCHRLHLHGELQITAQELTEARGALLKAGGRWAGEAPQKQLRLAAEPDAGWLNYLVGDLWRVGLTRTVLPRVAPDARPTNSAIIFDGNPVCSTDLLNKRAAELYDAHRRLISTARAKLF